LFIACRQTRSLGCLPARFQRRGRKEIASPPGGPLGRPKAREGPHPCQFTSRKAKKKKPDAPLLGGAPLRPLLLAMFWGARPLLLVPGFPLVASILLGSPTAHWSVSWHFTAGCFFIYRNRLSASGPGLFARIGCSPDIISFPKEAGDGGPPPRPRNRMHVPIADLHLSGVLGRRFQMGSCHPLFWLLPYCWLRTLNDSQSLNPGFDAHSLLLFWRGSEIAG